jgi:hypothetical protein
MRQLTVEERRRTFERRQAAMPGGRRPRAIATEQFAGRQRFWQRTVRFGALLALAAMAALLVAEAAPVVSLRRAPALIEWLLPRV